MHAAAIATVGNLNEHQQAVCRHLPQPMAAAWQELLLARSNVQLEQRLLTVVDVTLRTLAVLALCDYLRGPRVKAVEALLPTLAEPQPEAWFALLNAAVDAVFQRAEPRPFALELLLWAHGPRGEPAAGQRHLEKVIALRRELLHSTDTLVIEEAGTVPERLLGAILELCESLHWLGLYRLLRPASLTTLRQGGFTGRVQLLVGGAETPPSTDAAWSAHLLLDTVYWSNPDASALLEVSPFIRVLPHPRLKRSQCFLFAASPQLNRLQLRHDPSEVTVETGIATPNGECSLAQWLERRTEHSAWLENRDLSGSLAADPQLARSRSTPRPLSRPIPDLSAASFRQSSSWTGRRPSSTFTPQVHRQKRWLLIGQVLILVAIVVVGARLLSTARRGREHAVTIDDRGVASVVAKTRGGHEAAEAAADAPEPATVTAARLQAHAREVAMAAARRRFDEGSAVAESLPVYAALKWEIAAHDGDWRGDRELARLMAQALPAQRSRCQKHALRALNAQPGDAELTLIAKKCGVHPGEVILDDSEAWRRGLRDRAATEAARMVGGKKLQMPDACKLAKSLFADAGRLGSARGWLGVAHVAWFGEHNAGDCREALGEVEKIGGLGGAELDQQAALRAACGG